MELQESGLDKRKGTLQDLLQRNYTPTIESHEELDIVAKILTTQIQKALQACELLFRINFCSKRW